MPPPQGGSADIWPFWARFAQLLVGLVLFGGSVALLVRARLGLDSWDVLHQGLSRHTHVAIGTWAIVVSVVVLLLWVPLRQRPGIGTLCNVVLVGSRSMRPSRSYRHPTAWACVGSTCSAGSF